MTDGQKCALPTGTKLLVLSLVQAFAHEFAEHASGECPRPGTRPFPKLVDYDEEGGRFLYDRAYERVSPQWTEEPGPSSSVEA